MNITDFDAIRPFSEEELPAAFDRLLADEEFRKVIAYLYPDIPIEAVGMKMKQCRTGLDFQKAFCYGFLKDLLSKASTGCTFGHDAIDTTKHYTFISNHRDIVLDSAFLSVLLVDAGFTTTCEIAIGDNLLKRPWIKDLVRVNKSFIVERSLPPRQLFMASKRMADYMHYVIAEKNDNLWIAQREGRAKDSNDRTQDALLKMMAMGGEGTPAERLAQLHLVPLAINYEFDPCDYLKAAEAQLRRDNPGWKKGSTDDIISMHTGIMGYKGKIHYQATKCIDEWLLTLPADMPKNDFYTAVAHRIDSQIFSAYHLYPNNFIALDKLENTTAHADKYTENDIRIFDAYIDAQLKKVQIPNPDYNFLANVMYLQYANPARNAECNVKYDEI